MFLLGVSGRKGGIADDGIATGSTMPIAITLLRHQHAAQVVGA
ncbi:MAG: hypothetical protein ABIS50_06175 [Luteolibacter sp.]